MVIRIKYALLVKKLEFEPEKIIVAAKLKEYCKTLDIPYAYAISYLLANGYLIRIFREIFYIKSVEERKRNLIEITFYDAITRALELKGVTNWYFGLETALKLNNMTHEYFTMDVIISDKLRSKPFEILGHTVKFIKAKKELFSKGIITDKIKYSNKEKTILDIIYFGRYNDLTEEIIKEKVIDYLPACDHIKLFKFAEDYPRSVSKFLKKVYV